MSRSTNLIRNLGRPRKRQLNSEVAFVSPTVIPPTDNSGTTNCTVCTGFLQKGPERRGIIPAEIPHLLVSDEYSDCVRIVGVRGLRAQCSLLINLDAMFALPAARKPKKIGLVTGFARYLKGIAPALLATDLILDLRFSKQSE